MSILEKFINLSQQLDDLQMFAELEYNVENILQVILKRVEQGFKALYQSADPHAALQFSTICADKMRSVCSTLQHKGVEIYAGDYC